jgi:hypothetical protein
MVLTWVLWRRPRQERADLMAMVEAHQPDVTQQREVQAMGQTIAESLIEEGFEKGIEKGIEKGKLTIARETVRLLLEDRFGPLPESLVQRIDSINELPRLQAAFRQGLRLQKLDDLQL